MTRLVKRTKFRKRGYQPAGSHIIHAGGNARKRAQEAVRLKSPLDPPNRPDMAHIKKLRQWVKGLQNPVVSTPKMVFSKVVR